MSRYLGCHVSSSGGLENGIINGNALGVSAIQVHPSPPQRWNTSPYPAGYETKTLQALKEGTVKKVFFHAIYLINLANPDERMQNLSRLSLQHYLDLSSRINGAGVIFHVGSMKDEPDEEVGYDRAASALNAILEKCPDNARLILEVSAGSGKVIGDTFEDLATIYKRVERKELLGFGLDTQHMWASGYDLREALPAVIKNLEEAFTFENIWSVHLNDSKTALASRKDRHENLGDGLIGKEALEAFLNHPKLREIPFILETPDLKDADGAAREVKKLLEWAV
jgi:deoxyribonuclease-4